MITSRVPNNYGLFGLGDLNCPGDPGCPGNPVDTTGINNPIPPGGLSPAQLAAYSASNAAYFNPGPLTGFQAWLQANPTAAWWAAGAVFVLAFLSEGRR